VVKNVVDLAKSLEFFNPTELQKDRPIHIIGVGAIGSHVAEMLARLGCTNLNLYDFDIVDSKNIANQMYFDIQIGKSKLDSIMETLHAIDPFVKARLFSKGWTGQPLQGYVFLCVDSIELRRKITEEQMYNNNIVFMCDFRMRLSDAQHYAADWSERRNREIFLSTMQFTDKDAAAATPVSACGTELSVIPTVRVITAMGVSNFINFAKGEGLKKMILVDAFSFDVTAV
jgi:hypothetical protein